VINFYDSNTGKAIGEYTHSCIITDFRISQIPTNCTTVMTPRILAVLDSAANLFTIVLPRILKNLLSIKLANNVGSAEWHPNHAILYTLTDEKLTVHLNPNAGIVDRGFNSIRIDKTLPGISKGRMYFGSPSRIHCQDGSIHHVNYPEEIVYAPHIYDLARKNAWEESLRLVRYINVNASGFGLIKVLTTSVIASQVMGVALFAMFGSKQDRNSLHLLCKFEKGGTG